MEQPSRAVQKSGSPVKMIIETGLLSGIMDMVAVMTVYRVNPVRMCWYIAGAAFGKEAISGSVVMAVWGLAFHFFIALFWTILFFFLYPRINSFSKNIIVNGFLYGIVIWVVMNLVVLPLTKLPPTPLTTDHVIIGITIVMLMVGLPISFMVHRYFTNKRHIDNPRGAA